MFPGFVTDPPIIRSSFARINVWGSVAAQWAYVVIGPMPISVIVSSGFSRRRRRISRWEGVVEGVKRCSVVGGESVVAGVALVVKTSKVGGASNRCFHVSGGERCLC